MSEKEGRKEFVEPELIKCEEPLDEVTMVDCIIGTPNGTPNCNMGHV